MRNDRYENELGSGLAAASAKTASAARPARDDLLIEAGKAEREYWRDLWRYRELFYFLAWRDVLVRYKQTAIGVTWALIRPFLTVCVFTIVFGRIAKLPSGGVPYPLLVGVGMLPWQFFSTALTESSSSLLTNASLVSKVYFPRLIMPASSVITSLVDFAITLAMTMLLMLFYGVWPDLRLLALPFFLSLAFTAAMGAGLWLGALNTQYRDFRYVIPFVVQFGLYVTPVGFPSSEVPTEWRWLYALNPMVAVIDGFRWSMLRGHGALDPATLGSSLAISFGLLLSGTWFFRRMERTFADVI
jgi:lipopolysaccharide transport system permease protein